MRIGDTISMCDLRCKNSSIIGRIIAVDERNFVSIKIEYRKDGMMRHLRFLSLSNSIHWVKYGTVDKYNLMNLTELNDELMII